MPSRRTSHQPLSPRLFWVIAAGFVLFESTLLGLAYQYTRNQHRLTEQLALVHQGSAVAWQMVSSPSNDATSKSRQVWLGSMLHALDSGGSVVSLENTLAQLPPLDSPNARLAATRIQTHWDEFVRLNRQAPDSTPARGELAAMSAPLHELSNILSLERNEASRTAAVMGLIAVAAGILTFITAGSLMLHQILRFARSGQMLRSMMNQIGAGVCILSSGGRIADANRAACRMLGRPRKMLRGKRLEEILALNDGVWTGDRPDGLPIAVERIPGQIDSHKGPLNIVTLLDVTARHLTTECLLRLAHHDPLTGLPNRAYLEKRFKDELTDIQSDMLLGVAVLDLDGFKPVNDTYGHAIGDSLLVQIAQRLSSALRISDMLARTGGDEFVVLFPDVGGRESLAQLGERLLGVFNDPFLIAGHRITMGCSIGLSIAPDDGTDQDSLLRAADAAMYQAKHAGKRRVRLTAVKGAGATLPAGPRSRAIG
ncbi:MAG: sensor domain-containing diguanylate cyclase [Proteobacteria bacterium]|nr:sensor domain-containing diguanylate cyclase [Pseudomonadota bacterium]